MSALAQKIVQEVKTARELREGSCVLLPQACNIRYAETAEILGVATVVRLLQVIRNQVAGKSSKKKYLWRTEAITPQFSRGRSFSC